MFSSVDLAVLRELRFLVLIRYGVEKKNVPFNDGGKIHKAALFKKIIMK